MKLIIYSGGMDSTVLLYKERPNIKLAVSFNYGSKHNNREMIYAAMNCRELYIDHVTISLESVMSSFDSALLNKDEKIPEGHYQDESMKRTVVPFRNGIMLSIATGIAESNNLESVLIANHAGDHAIYPDCRQDFIVNFGDAMRTGTYGNIKLDSPFVDWTKREIALFGKSLKVDFSKTYSCYNGQEKHCGKCGTCVERQEALEGFDTTKYKGD